MSQKAKTKQEIEAIINRVSFLDRTFRLMEKGDGYLVQMEYMEPDVDKPGSEPVKQSTRKWYISPYMTESEIVETCWAMVLRSQQHVASEHFTYKGRRVYSQHFDINYRISGCDLRAFDVRDQPDCFVRSDSGICERGTRGCISHPQRRLTPEQFKSLYEKDPV